MTKKPKVLREVARLPRAIYGPSYTLTDIENGKRERSHDDVLAIEIAEITDTTFSKDKRKGEKRRVYVAGYNNRGILYAESVYTEEDNKRWGDVKQTPDDWRCGHSNVKHHFKKGQKWIKKEDIQEVPYPQWITHYKTIERLVDTPYKTKDQLC